MPLSDIAMRIAKRSDNSQKLADAGGLYLLLTRKGAKWWRFDYRFAGKRKTLSMGTYPDTTLVKAPENRDAARKLLATGVDPGEHRKAEKSAGADRSANSFEVIAREWFVQQLPAWVPDHASKIIARMERDLFPWLGARPVAEVSAPELLKCLR